MKKLLLISICVAGMCFLTIAETTVTREVIGVGATRDDAIKNGLYHAVAQTKGVEVGSGDYRFGYRSATVDVNRTGTNKRIEFDAVSIETAGSLLRTDVAGMVKTYEVLEEKKTDDGNYQVKLKVWVLDYESLDNANRIRLAIMPIGSAKTDYLFGLNKTPGAHIASQLSQKLSSALAATNKFMVLDREYVNQLSNEKMMVDVEGSVEEKAKLRETLGADYVLVGTISDAFLVKTTKKLAATGRNTNEYRARFVYDFRLLGGPTRHIRMADTVELKLETEDVKALYDLWEPGKVDMKEMGDKIVAEVARQAVEAIAGNFYPIRVASIDASGKIIVNQGSRRLTEGSLLDVYAQGREILDVDTQESLGKTEVKVATIKIEKVLPKMAYAIVVEGDLAKISEGYICKYKQVQEPLQGRRGNVERAPGGGVVMPFD